MREAQERTGVLYDVVYGTLYDGGRMREHVPLTQLVCYDGFDIDVNVQPSPRHPSSLIKLNVARVTRCRGPHSKALMTPYPIDDLELVAVRGFLDKEEKGKLTHELQGGFAAEGESFDQGVLAPRA